MNLFAPMPSAGKAGLWPSTVIIHLISSALSSPLQPWLWTHARHLEKIQLGLGRELCGLPTESHRAYLWWDQGM